MARPLPFIEAGTVFNFWTVIESQSVKSGKCSFFKCQCQCGFVGLVRSDHLKFGNSKSCGCLLFDDGRLKERFWSKASLKDNGCLEWNQCRRGEYGVTTYKSKQWRAHRLAYYFAYGKFDLSLHVLHRCDNPRCINPDHLFLGTIQDNNKDCKLKDRHTKGETRNFKLVEKDVIRIRRLRTEQKISVKELASIFDVSTSMIEKIIYRAEWKHI